LDMNLEDLHWADDWGLSLDFSSIDPWNC
jgi:hypothetical protein